jgi:hypothetical protein
MACYDRLMTSSDVILATPLLNAQSNLLMERPRYAPNTDWTKVQDGAHIVQFYEHEATLLELVSGFVGSSLVNGGSSIVIATTAHRDGLAKSLRARGFNLTVARKQGRYMPLDAAATLEKILRDGWPDADRFGDLIGGAMGRASRAAAESRCCVSAFGEMVALLCAQGRTDAAIRLEQLWNDVADHHVFSLCCAYPLNTFRSESDRAPFLKICAQHSHVFSAEDVTESAALQASQTTTAR